MKKKARRAYKEMRILIVDDSGLSRDLIGSYLTRSGYKNLVKAESAVEAFGVLGLDGATGDAQEIDLILMDIIMEDIDGIEATKRIRQETQLRDIPIVMVTGSEKSDTFEEAFSAGARDYVSKPINMMELRVRVSSALKLKRETDLRKERERELELLSSLDGLTGIANRRIFDTTLDKEWNLAQRNCWPLSLIMIDIDFFKPYNDHYGHQGGDDCLQRVALAINGVPKRPGALVARYGGEEFVVILPDTEASLARQFAELIQKTVSGLQLPHEKSKIAPFITVSIGMSTSPLDKAKADSFEELLKRADMALYKAKQAGRNQVMAS